MGAGPDMTTSSSSDAIDLEKQPESPSAETCNSPLDGKTSHSFEKEVGKDGGKINGDADRRKWRRERSSTSEEGGGEGGARTDDSDNDGHEGQRISGRSTMIHRVLSRVTSRSSVDPGPPPDGGWLAWSQCVVALLVILNTWGWINSFGSFQAYYTAQLGRSASEVSWIGSLNVFLLFFVGTFTGRLTDAGYFRVVFLTGSILSIVGIFMISLCTKYWQLLLSQGICMGIAHGCLFCPAVAVVSTYFSRKRGIVLGIASCGSVAGGLIFPSMVRQLLPFIGFPWTVRAIGFVQLGVLVAANLLARTRVRPRKAGSLVDWSAFKELEYAFYAVGAFFNYWGVYFAFFYIAAFSRDALHPPLSYPDSLNLLLILNGIGVIGRVVPSHFADRIGAINAFIPVSVTASMLLFCFIVIKSPAGLYVWAAFYGISAGGVQSLLPTGVASLVTDLRRLGTRLGMVFTIVSFAVLTGPPIAGAIVGSPAGYTGAKIFAGSSIAVGAGFLMAAKVVRMHKTGQGWTGRI